MTRSYMYRLLWILLFSSVLSAAPAYKTEYFQSTDGLPSDVVIKALKKDGILYLATQKGLSIYDGYVFVNSPEISKSVFDFVEKDGKIYAEESGVGLIETENVFSPKKIISSVNYFDDTPDNDHYKSIYKDNLGNIWCSDFHFLKYINPAKKRQKHFRVAHSKTQLTHSFKFVETEKSLYAVSAAGLFVWDKKTDNLLKINNLPFFDIIRHQDKIILLTQKGELYEIKDGTEKLKFITKINLNQPASFVKTFISKDVLALYDSGNVFYYHLKTSKLTGFFTTENYINHVFYDDETAVFWISTQKGLIKLTLDKGIISNIALSDSSKTPVTDIVEDKNGNIWLIKNGSALYEISNGAARHVPIAETRLNRIACNGEQVLLATNSGVFRKEINGNFRKIIATSYPVTKAVYFEQKYWVMPETGAIRVFDEKTLTEIPDYLNNTEDFYRGNLFNDLAVSGENQLWAACWFPRDFGIVKYNSEARKFETISGIFKNEPKFVADYFNRVRPLKNGNMIFSATSGFNIVSPQGEIVYSMNSELNKVASDNTMGIDEDKDGNIWFGSAEGLYLYKLKENKAIRISKTEGLHSNNVVFGFLIDHHNQLYLSNEQTLEKID